jgi:hypothetical protein
MGLGLSSYAGYDDSSDSSSDGWLARRRERRAERQPSINRANKDYIKDLQAQRAAGTLGLSEGQKDDMVAQATGQAGAATQSLLAQMPPSGDQASQQALMRTAASGMQNAVTQAKANADMASQQQAANKAAELAAQEQPFFARRAANRKFVYDIHGDSIAAAGNVIGGAAGAAGGAAVACWVAVALWGECERTRMARLHVKLSRGVFYDAYRKYGRAWARWLNTHPWAKPLVAPIWYYLAWRGERTLRLVAKACDRGECPKQDTSRG